MFMEEEKNKKRKNSTSVPPTKNSTSAAVGLALLGNNNGMCLETTLFHLLIHLGMGITCSQVDELKTIKSDVDKVRTQVRCQQMKQLLIAASFDRSKMICRWVPVCQCITECIDVVFRCKPALDDIRVMYAAIGELTTKVEALDAELSALKVKSGGFSTSSAPTQAAPTQTGVFDYLLCSWNVEEIAETKETKV